MVSTRDTALATISEKFSEDKGELLSSCPQLTQIAVSNGIFSLLRKMTEYQASDLYITVGLPPSLRNIKFITETHAINPGKYRKDDEPAGLRRKTAWSCDPKKNLFAYSDEQGTATASIFSISSRISALLPADWMTDSNLEELRLNIAYKDAIMGNRGLFWLPVFWRRKIHLDCGHAGLP